MLWRNLRRLKGCTTTVGDGDVESEFAVAMESGQLATKYRARRKDAPVQWLLVVVVS